MQSPCVGLNFGSTKHGMRPDEAYTSTWPQIMLDGDHGFVQILEGKSKAARRRVPLMPDAVNVLRARHQAQGVPSAGWVFPTSSSCGHLTQDTTKGQHAAALRDSGVRPFEPYCLRHTAPTRLAPHCDPFTLARIAGHSSIAITQRYCHPQADTIQHAFDHLARQKQLESADQSSKQKWSASSANGNRW